MNKVLTISIAAYNVEKYLQKTLDSLVGQKDILDKLEIFIVDDASSDSTKEIGEKYAAKYANSVYIFSKKNGGWGSTVNYSISKAHGKFFRVLDGDDWFIQENLEEYVIFLERIEADLVLAPYVKFYEKNHASEIVSRHSLDSGIQLDISSLDKRKLQNIHMHELTIKTDLLQKNNIRITEHCFYTDEEYVFLPALHAKTLARYDKAIYCYRLGLQGQSVSIESRKKNRNDAGTVAKRLITEWKKVGKNLPEALHYSLEIELKKLILFQYDTMLLVDASSEIKRELQKFDDSVKEIPKIYKSLEKESKTIWWLRHSMFRLYRVFHIYTKRKMQ